MPALSQSDLHAAIKLDCVLAVVNTSISEGMASSILEVVLHILDTTAVYPTTRDE